VCVCVCVCTWWQQRALRAYWLLCGTGILLLFLHFRLELLLSPSLSLSFPCDIADTFFCLSLVTIIHPAAEEEKRTKNGTWVFAELSLEPSSTPRSIRNIFYSFQRGVWLRRNNWLSEKLLFLLSFFLREQIWRGNDVSFFFLWHASLGLFTARRVCMTPELYRTFRGESGDTVERFSLRVIYWLILWNTSFSINLFVVRQSKRHKKCAVEGHFLILCTIFHHMECQRYQESLKHWYNKSSRYNQTIVKKKLFESMTQNRKHHMNMLFGICWGRFNHSCYVQMLLSGVVFFPMFLKKRKCLKWIKVPSVYSEKLRNTAECLGASRLGNVWPSVVCMFSEVFFWLPPQSAWTGSAPGLCDPEKQNQAATSGSERGEVPLKCYYFEWLSEGNSSGAKNKSDRSL